ncbi:Crossover junction endonuclease EME1 [Oopsacas minuta]|uniref:Crossover junction endonuclease EME1 n=1 Tax=Oopsacas minuta TaxID=111878 RepID=A0AAV7JDH2_9METZ|nr:Crossover junction endonuclease EME1 [Oopsacas minuta]
MSFSKLKIMLKSRFFGENLLPHYYAAFWLADGSSKTCASCDGGFSIFNRRHHCRLCGYIFHSGACCPVYRPGNESQLPGDLAGKRVCRFCKQFLESAQSFLTNGIALLHIKMGIGPSTITLRLSEDFNYLELSVAGMPIERIGLDTIDDIRMGMGCMSNIVESGVDPLKSLHIRVRDDHSSLPIKMYDFKVSTIPDCYLIIESLRSLLYVYKAKTIQSHLLNSLQNTNNLQSLDFNGREYMYLRGIFLRHNPDNVEYSYTDGFVNIGIADLGNSKSKSKGKQNKQTKIEDMNPLKQAVHDDVIKPTHKQHRHQQPAYNGDDPLELENGVDTIEGTGNADAGSGKRKKRGKKWVPLRIEPDTQSNPGGKPKRGPNHSTDKSHSHVSHSTRSTPPLDRGGRSHSPSSTSSNELSSSKHSYSHPHNQYGQYMPHIFIPSPAFSNLGAPFHPTSGLGPHALYPVSSLQPTPHPPGIPTGSHPIGQITSIPREHMNVYRDSSIQPQIPVMTDMPGYSPQIFPTNYICIWFANNITSECLMDLLTDDESSTPTMDEIYDAEIIKPKVNNNKIVDTTDSDDSDLPELTFVDTNKSQQQQQQQLSLVHELIRSIIPEEHIGIVTNDFRITGDVNVSINRYFEGNIWDNEFHSNDLDNGKICASSSGMNSMEISSCHDDAKICSYSKATSSCHDNTKICSEFIVNKFASKSADSKNIFFDEKNENFEEFSLQFSPLSCENEMEQTATTTSLKRKHSPIINKQTETECPDGKQSKQINYTITTTTNFDKHLLAHLKNGIKTPDHSDVTFDQTPSINDTQYVHWRYKQSTTTSKQNSDYICVIFSMIEFAKKYQKDRQFIENIFSTLFNTKVLLLVYGVKEYFSHLEAGNMSRATFDTLQTYFQIHLHLTIHLANSILEASDILVRIMRGVMALANRKERTFQFVTSYPRSGKGVKNRDDETKIWINQLLQFSRISEKMALAIVEKYPTPAVLKLEYLKCENETEKRYLLRNILVNKRRIGSKLSENIYLFFNSKDAKIKI